MRSALAALLVSLAVAAAGCADDPAALTIDSTTTGSPSPTLDPALDYGSLAGVVTDDAQAPLLGVQISILETELAATSDDGGAFRFESVPLGKHSVAANKPGYESKVSIVEILVEPETKITFVLSPIATQEPFVEVFSHTLRHVAGTLLLDAAAGTYGVPTCEGCKWTQKTNGINEGIVLEITGTHAVTNPLGPAQEYVEIQKNKPFVLLASGIHALPAKLTLASGVITDTQDFLFYGSCDPDWFCLDEKREFWMSAFHFAAPSEDYSALPKA